MDIQRTKCMLYRRLTLALYQKIEVTKLPVADGAAFDSHVDEQDARCHPDTRVELRDQIRRWAFTRHSKGIFWLCGVAGTGKSTISRTIAQSLADEGALAASFFFKRGGGDRARASRFFSTIVSQMLPKLPSFSLSVSEAIEADEDLPRKSLKDQFERLLEQPLSKLPTLPPAARLVIVIDALDECENEGHIRTILSLLSRALDVAAVSL
jgi:Mrp family chromosome partitioning ATPase